MLQEIRSLENIIAAFIFARKFYRQALLFPRKYYETWTSQVTSPTLVSYLKSVIYRQIALCTLSLFAGQSEKLGLVQAHVKLCKEVSNDGLYHVVMNYDVYVGFYIISPKRCMSIALLALCLGLLTPTLIAGTALSTQEDLHTTNVSYNFAKTHKQPDFSQEK